MGFFRGILATARANGALASRVSGVCALVLAFGACNIPGASQDSFQPVQGSCRIATDQTGAFMSRVDGFPIPVRIDSAFSADERSQALEAIRSWNDYGRQLIREDFFTIAAENEDLPDSINTADCESEIGGSQNTLILARSTRRAPNGNGRERVSDPANAVGITYRCTLGEVAERQVTIIHVDRVDPTQVQSVVLHELGHALGLDHSCDMSGGGRSDFRSCFGISQDHPYRMAVMYPTLQIRETSGAPERKDDLTQNDRDRMACRYGPQ